MLLRLKLYGLFLFIICQVLSFGLIAQSRIHGIIVDKLLKTVANANVLLLNFSDSSLIKGSISSADGSFAFENISKGRYVVSTTFTGFERTYSSAINIGEQADQVDIGIISLSQSISELNSVTVT